jgi:hypothetical protein
MQSSIEKLKKLENIIEKRKQSNRDFAENTRKLIGKLRNNIGKNRKKNSNTQNKINQLPYHKIENWIVNNQINSIDSYHDSLSHGQVKSKMWMVENLPKGNDLHIEIIGGWFGCPLIDLLNSKLNIKKIDFYEIDDSCKKVLAQYLNYFKFNFKVSVFGDFFERKELRRRDLIINTSSEHMPDITQMKQYFKGNPAIAVQSNDYFELEEHTNCVNNVEELILKNQIKKVWFKGDKEFEKYNRFMVIGQWHD